MARKPNFKNISIVIIYIVLSYLIMLFCITHPNLILSFLVSLIFNLISTIVFLNLFISQNSSDFIKKLEQIEEKNQKKYLQKFLRFGKFLTCIILSLIGGPIFLSLTIKLILNNSHHKYLIAITTCTISNFIFISFSRGLFQLTF
jgi:hypothetical protein